MQSIGQSSKRGFTLLEIMITVMIISVMAGLAIPSYFSVVEEGRSSEARTNISVLHMGLKVYNLNNSTYNVVPAITDIATANTALSLDMVSQNYDLTNFAGAAAGYTVTFTRNGNNGGARNPPAKTFTATYPDLANPTGPPAIVPAGNY